MNKNRTRTLRMTTMAVTATVISIGAVSHTGLGSLSAFGVGGISAICPVGYLETMLVGHTVVPYLFLSFLVIVGLTVLFGRFFCGWICPVPLVRKVLTNNINESEVEVRESISEHSVAVAADVDKEIAKTACSGQKTQKSVQGLVILGVTLGSSMVWGFPVFCILCPVGLIFATLVALIRLINFNDPSIDLLVFPAVLIVELVLVKKWCRNLCPIGALFSLFGRFNRTFLPTIDTSLCLETSSGTKCKSCQSACALDIELKNGSGTGDISECTKCRECADHCPVQAIRFPWR